MIEIISGFPCEVADCQDWHGVPVAWIAASLTCDNVASHSE